MKTCRKCNVEKPLTDYYNGCRVCKPCRIQQSSDCKNKNREKYLLYQKEYHKTKGRQFRRDRFAWMDDIKKNPCQDCKQTYPPECMDFDHRDPSTKCFNVSQAAVSGYSLERVKAEIAKCDLLCANCHRIRTAKQQRRNKAGKNASEASI